MNPRIHLQWQQQNMFNNPSQIDSSKFQNTQIAYDPTINIHTITSQNTKTTANISPKQNNSLNIHSYEQFIKGTNTTGEYVRNVNQNVWNYNQLQAQNQPLQQGNLLYYNNNNTNNNNSNNNNGYIQQPTPTIQSQILNNNNKINYNNTYINTNSNLPCNNLETPWPNNPAHQTIQTAFPNNMNSWTVNNGTNWNYQYNNNNINSNFKMNSNNQPDKEQYETPKEPPSNISIYNIVQNYNNINYVNNTDDKNKTMKLEEMASDFWKDEFMKPQIQWWISSKNITLEGKPIGIGGSSDVYIGDYRGTRVAVKKIRIWEAKEENWKEFKREVSSWIMWRHPNLVLFMGAIADPDNISIVTEYCAGGTLFDILHKKRDLVWTWKLRAKLLLEIAIGMNFLHTNTPPIIHRDLKSLNIWLTEKIEKPTDGTKIKISDFGLSKILKQLDANNQMTGQLGTCHWMAPEVIENKNYSIKADVYSFGIILWEMMTRKTPYGGMTQQQIGFYVSVKKGRPDKTFIPMQTTPPTLIQWMEICWDPEPDKRPSFEMIINYLRKLI